MCCDMCCDVDIPAMQVWKDEAFALWTTAWASLYEAGSSSAQLLTEIQDTYYLVSLLDNNYIDSDLFKVIGAAVKKGHCIIM